MYSTSSALQQLVTALKDAIPSFEIDQPNALTIQILSNLAEEEPSQDKELLRLLHTYAQQGQVVDQAAGRALEEMNYKIASVGDTLRRYADMLQWDQELSERKLQIDQKKSNVTQALISRTRAEFLAAATRVANVLSRQVYESGAEDRSVEDAQMEASMSGKEEPRTEQESLDQLFQQEKELNQERQDAVDDLKNIARQMEISLSAYQAALKDFQNISRKKEDVVVSALGDITNHVSHAVPSKADQGKRSNRRKPSYSEIVEQAGVIDSLRKTHSNLQEQRQEVLNQARISSLASISLLCLGTLLVFAGIICVYTINLNAGIITIAASAVIDVVGALILRYNQQTTRRLDLVGEELTKAVNATTAMYLIGYIGDAEKRDQAIIELIQQLSTHPNRHEHPRTGRNEH